MNLHKMCLSVTDVIIGKLTGGVMVALRIIKGRSENGTGNGNGNGNGVNGIARNGNGRNGNGHNGRNGHGEPGVDRPFIRNLRSLIGENVTLATTCGTVRGTLQQVFDDHVLLRHNGSEQHVRIKQICFVAVERDHGG